MSATLTIVIDNPDLLSSLCGPNDCNLREISGLLDSPVRSRGNRILLDSPDEDAQRLFKNLIKGLSEAAGRNRFLDQHMIRSFYDSLENGGEAELKSVQDSVIIVPPAGNRVYPRGRRQTDYIRYMSSKDLILCVGPAGTGKTYLAVAHALMELLTKKKRKIVLTRPVMESGENLGFLPGDLTQKLAPYLLPLYDAMESLIDTELLQRLKENGQVEVAPLAYMRGRSLKNCYIILDEAQNTSIEQMKMFLTRFGEGSRAVVTGDLTQVDLPRGQISGLTDVVGLLEGMDDIAIVKFESEDVVRHPLVKKIIDVYEKARNHRN